MEKIDVFEKQNLFFFIFGSKLKYSKKEGYRTLNNPYFISLFDVMMDLNSSHVEMTGIEPVYN